MAIAKCPSSFLKEIYLSSRSAAGPPPPALPPPPPASSSTLPPTGHNQFSRYYQRLHYEKGLAGSSSTAAGPPIADRSNSLALLQMEPAAAAAAAAAEAAAFGPTHYQQHYAALMASYNRDVPLNVVSHIPLILHSLWLWGTFHDIQVTCDNLRIPRQLPPTSAASGGVQQARRRIEVSRGFQSGRSRLQPGHALQLEAGCHDATLAKQPLVGSLPPSAAPATAVSSPAL